MLELRDVSLRLGGAAVFEGLSFALAAGERLALMGPSGCGKTSLLRLCAGLLKPDAGTVRRDTERVAFLFQEPRLLPWRTAAENVNLVLSDRAGTMGEAEAWLARFGLDTADARKRPAELSGGMQQRASLARCLASGGELLLLDEPFKALDAALRRETMQTVSDLAGGAAVLLVTHDPAEAEDLGCRIVRFEELLS